MRINSLYKEPWPRIIGIPIISFLMTLISKDEITFTTYAISFLFTFVIWNADYYIITRFRIIIPKLEDTSARLLYTVLIVCASNIALDFIICSTLGYCNVEGFGDYWGEHFYFNLYKNLGATFIVGTLYETGYYFNRWKGQSIEMEQLKSQQLRSELSVLKNQISPHFLFNSLNTLVALIHENPNQAARFTEKLSQVYRYILQYKEKEIVKLPIELEFIKAYNFLMKIRFEKSLILNVSIKEEYMQRYIAPLTIQMLIENAVKHNIVSSSKPLTVDVYIENGKSLIVRNNLQVRLSGVKSMNTGLENIKQRYLLLSNREVDIIQTSSHFIVALPLIEVSSESEVFSQI